MQTFSRKIPLILVFNVALMSGVLSLPALAQSPTANSASTPEQAQQTPAGKFIQTLGANAISIVADQSLSQDQRTAKYRTLLQAAFDLQTIGHFVVGRAWDAATPEQQQEYLQLFEAFVLKVYENRLAFYSGESFHVKSARQENDRDVIVSSEIDHPGGTQPTLVDWRVRQIDTKLAIVDVVIAGISQSVTQRQEFAAIIQRDGGKIDGLLDVLRQRVQGTSSSPN